MAFYYSFLLAYSGHHAEAIAISRATMRAAPDHPTAWAPESFACMLAGRHTAAMARLATAPSTAPPSALLLFRGLAHLATADRASALESLDQVVTLEPDAFTVIGAFLAQASRGDAERARAALVPEFATGIWKDMQYTENVAQGFALLGDVEEAARWLEQSVALGLGIHEAVTRHNAVWRPWLDHPRFVPILEWMKQNAERYAQLPVAPRALAMVD